MAQRVAVVDFLRGCALFGILAVNVWFFVPEGVGGWAQDLVRFLFATKSYLLFAFLFGYSFVLQRRAASRAGRSFVPMMRRRLIGLFVLGLLHGLTLFSGDILLPYAALGLLLLMARDLAPSRAVRLAIVLTLATAGVLLFLGALVWLAERGAGPVANAADSPVLTGSPLEVLASRVTDYLPTLGGIFFIQGVPAFAAMLAGLAAAKWDLFAVGARQERLWHAGTPAAPIIGLLGAALFTWGLASGDPGSAFLAFGITTATAPLLTGTYVAILSRWWENAAESAIVRGIGATGRLSLTNYLGQSVALNLVFTGLGLSLADRVTGATVLAIVVLVFMVQVLLSSWWAGSHRYGPAEWALRRWTYGGRVQAGGGARPVDEPS